MSDRFHWARLLAHVSLVNQELLLRNEYCGGGAHRNRWRLELSFARECVARSAYREAGSFHPFARTRSGRANGDSRLSIEERYTGREQYLGKIAVAARRLIAHRLLLPTDFPEVIDQALVQYDWAVQA